MCTAYPTNWNIKMSFFLVAKMCLKTETKYLPCPQMVGYVWTSCRILLCVIQNNPSPLPPSPFQYTQVLSVNLTDKMYVSVHPVQSHASLCHCLLHVHTKTVDGFICVRVLASLLFCSLFLFRLFFILIVSLCLWRGWELVLQTKKTAQLPLKVNGTVIDKVRTCTG